MVKSFWEESHILGAVCGRIGSLMAYLVSLVLFGEFVGATPAILADLGIMTPRRNIEVPAAAFASVRPGNQTFEL